MKAILCFAVLLAVSSVTFFPSWKLIQPSNVFKVTSVYAQSNAQVGQNNILTVCGNSLYETQVRSFAYQVGQGNEIWSIGNVDLTQKTIPEGNGYCFFYNYVVPSQAQGAHGYSVDLVLENSMTIVASVQVDFSI
jgi:hypothetical protein